MPLVEIAHPKGIEQTKTVSALGPGLSINRSGNHVNGVSSATPQVDDDSFAVLALRNLLFDICNQHGGGHGGSAIGMAAIGVALYKYVMRYNPSDPDWFDRDRFVLSNGHAAMFLYALNHLIGIDAWTLDELKGYGSAKMNGFTTLCHAHPEIEVPGVEVTTGPLGQGIANAVGLAIASKNLAARYNTDAHQIIQSRIYCMTGDGCLMEGVALESISLAGHLQLDSLTLIYDNNSVTCDGPLDWINSEDINTKMRACGWHVLEVADGSYDVKALVSTFEYAKTLTGKPVFININTVIGLGTQVAGTAKAHHGTFDSASVTEHKRMAGIAGEETHFVPHRARTYFDEIKSRGRALQSQWETILEAYSSQSPKWGKELQSRIKSEVGTHCFDILDNMDTSSMSKQATRTSNGQVMERLWTECLALCGGGADLVTSNQIKYSETDVFHPLLGHSGRFIRYGIREHAMASISNGIAAYNKGTFIPITATFFMFYLYAAPGIRMGALSHLQALHFATHDSFAEGQNGPTHQPIEVDSLYRAMPNLTYFRPCDAEEVCAAWIHGLRSKTSPTMVSLGRDPVGPVPNTCRQKALKGAYTVIETSSAEVTLVACGTQLHRVVAAAELLEKEGVAIRVVSAPCLSLFDQQDDSYKDQVFPKDGSAIVSVEEYVATTWARYTTASIGMDSYGYSASAESNYQRFGLDKDSIARKVKRYLNDVKAGGGNARMLGWRKI
ncbi:Dihydroxyacetone synthase-like protein 3 [Elsinoe fawcettii]|nr:Dihydroxyacetone synthase-like protein 3 [Elsinoe fawcettii]